MYTSYIKTLAEWHRIKANHPRGTVLEGLKKRQIGSGLLVNFGKYSGLIRQHELDWAKRNYPALFAEDDPFITAEVIGYDDDLWQLKLGLEALVQQEIIEKLKCLAPNHVVVGRVTGFVDEYITRNSGEKRTTPGVFLELGEGLTGFLPRREIPLPQKSGAMGRMDEVLFLDDYVECAVDKVEPDALRLRLKVKSRTDRWNLQKKESQNRAGQPEIREEDSVKETDKGSPEFVAVPAEERRILLIEDDQEVVQSTETLLKLLGHTVTLRIDSVERAEKVLEKTQKPLPPYDFILVDMILNGKSRGLELALEFQREQPNAQIIIITAQTTEKVILDIQNHVQEILCALQKPYDIKLLDDLLQKPELPEGISKINLSSSSFLAKEDFPISSITSRSGQDFSASLSLAEEDAPISSITSTSGQDLEETHRRLSRRLREEFPGVGIIVMKRNLASGQFEKIYSKGIDESFVNVLLYDLRYSPIGDVIWKGEFIFDSYVEKGESKFYQKLQLLTSFSAFIGVPVTVYGQHQYGIFLLQKEGSFSLEDYAKARVSAAMFGVDVERALAAKSLIEQHHIYTIGSLLAGMYHEIGNALGVVCANTASISKLCGNPGKDVLEKIQSISTNLSDNATNLIDTVHTFLGIAEKHQAHGESIPYIINTIGKTLSEIAETYDVRLQIEEPPPALNFYLFPGIGLRQAIFNLVLNGIQQVKESRVKNGFVKVRAKIKSGEARLIQVEVEDNANGIHDAYNELIFSAFFTTREDGTGLGLYLAREFMHGLGGKISIKDTRRFGGSTFLIKLPKPNVKR